MSRYLSITLSILLLIFIVIGTLVWVRAFSESVVAYNSPLRNAVLSPQTSSLSKTATVVVVLVSGLGFDTAQALELPVFEQLSQTGANAAVLSSPPTYAQTAQATIITGAPAETNSASPIDLPVAALSPLAADTIFARAHEAQQKTILLGLSDWQRLIPRNHLDETFFVNTSGPDADQAIVEMALSILKNGDYDLVLIQLTQLDYAAKRQGGPSGAAYRTAADRVDAYLGQISRAIDTSREVLVVLSDHGSIASGGHGGDEVEVVWQPFVMIGQGIAPGSYSDIEQIDIAPTISMLLGLAPPTATQGRILFEMLRLNENEQAVAQMTLAQQRVALVKAYLAQITGTPVDTLDTLDTDLAQVHDTYTQNNVGGAFQLAKLTQENAEAQMATARHRQIRLEQWPRLLVVLFILSVWLILMWRRRGTYAGLIIVATVIAVGLYHLLYQIQGFSYSISSINDFSQLPFGIARRTTVSLLAGGGLMLVILMLANERDWVNILGVGFGFSVLVTFTFALPLFWTFWLNGPTIKWYLPAVGPVFWQISAVYEVMVSAFLGLLLPWPIMFLTLLVSWTRRFLDENQANTEPDALPGLHL
jgi:hypothetical protein